VIYRGLCAALWASVLWLDGGGNTVECTPSFLLALAVALAGESLSYIEIYRELVRQVVEAREYREAVEKLLKEK
jgi:hypothetical protein